MKCMYSKCDNELIGRKKTYCSDRCRKAQSRTETGSKVGQNETRTQSRTKVTELVKQVADRGGEVLFKTVKGKVQDVHITPAISNFGQSDCQCQHCQNNRAIFKGEKYVINHGPYKSAGQLGEKELNRVSLPGDPDYDGVCLDSKYDSRRTNL